MMGFRERLAARQKAVNSLVCVGLDPLEGKVPAFIKGDSPAEMVASHMMDIADASAPCACMFKPNSAFYERIPGGREALQDVIKHIHKNYPDIPVFLDCKRGDIGNTQEQYREAHFGLDGVDGINFSPYMGKDCMSALVNKEKYPGHAIVGLCYTSNPAARQVQDILMVDNRSLWERIAELTRGWADELGITEDAGLVMAAAYEPKKGSGEIYSTHLSRCREIVGDKLWFLIPGIGTQGGFIAETVRAAFTGPGSIAINSSSGIIFASSGEDYAEAAVREAEKLRDAIRAAGGNC